jgi:NADPH2:quinone reductase
MWTIEVEDPGANSKLVKGTRPMPSPLRDEVLIKTSAAGINRADIFQRNGLYPPPKGASDVIGLEVSGIIEKIGSNVKNFKVGDKVCALLEGGGYAQYSTAPASQTLPIPENLDFIEGAALPEALFTVYSNFFHHAKIKKGESFLIHGGASGIGTFAVQVARECGITCYATAGSDAKCHFIEELGAYAAINYKNTDFVEEIKKLTEQKGVNCIIDIVGGDYFNRNLRALATGGRMICLSFLQGAETKANLAPILFKNLTIMGTTLRNKTTKQKAKIAEDLKNNIWPLVESGKIKPVISKVFHFHNVMDAHKLMESGRHIGKIILKCN